MRPADADDAGGSGSLRPKCAQLMLMMLAVRGLCVQNPAEAHDAGGLGSLSCKVRQADAHDAGGLGSLRPKCAQLMLMMLAVWGL